MHLTWLPAVTCCLLGERVLGRPALTAAMCRALVPSRGAAQGKPCIHATQTRCVRACRGLWAVALNASPVQPKGPMFKPIERGSQMLVQLFDEQGQVCS